jgi:hypothetical protein
MTREEKATVNENLIELIGIIKEKDLLIKQLYTMLEQQRGAIEMLHLKLEEINKK